MDFKVVAVLSTSLIPGDFSEKVRQLGAEFWVKDCRTEDERIAATRNVDFIITVFGRYPFTRRIIEKLVKCKFIETVGIGYDGVDLEAPTEHGIGIIHNAGFCKEELSDHAMALILAHSRWILGLHHRVTSGKPVVSASPEAMQRMTRLQGKTLGLIGLGYSGKAMVPKAKGFGMRIVAHDPYLDRRIAEELKVEMVNLNQLIEEADFISIHANLTTETKHLIGLREFKKMKRNAFIVNTSRGAIIDESALCVALSKGYVAGAGLDVTDPEPPPKDSQLFSFDNVIVTGHNAGASPEAHAAMWSFPLEEIARVIRREWPIGLVNPEVKKAANSIFR